MKVGSSTSHSRRSISHYSSSYTGDCRIFATVAKSVKSSLRSIYGVGKPLKVLFQGFPTPYMERSELYTFCYCCKDSASSCNKSNIVLNRSSYYENFLSVRPNFGALNTCTGDPCDVIHLMLGGKLKNRDIHVGVP